MFFSAHISPRHLLVAAGVAAAFAVASGIPAVAAPIEIVIVNGAVADKGASAESRADHSIPMLPVVYDDSKGK